MISTRDLETHLRSLALPGLPAGRAVIPDYDGYAISSVPALIRRLFGENVAEGADLGATVLERVAAPARKVVLLVVDGLGLLHLQDLVERYPDLYLARLIEGGLLVPLTSVFPSTTVAALTTFNTGLTPQEHGMVGYRLYLKETLSITNMIHLSLLGNAQGESAVGAGINLEAFVGAPSLSAALSRLGVETHTVLPRPIHSSGLSRILYSSSDKIHPVVDFADMLVATRGLLRQVRGPAFISLYWPGADTIAHTYGPWTEQFTAELRAIDSALECELAGQAGDALFLLASDHGFVAMERADYRSLFDQPDLERDLLLPPLGEPRASYLYVREGRKEAVAEKIAALGGGLVCLDARAALSSGLFGRGPVKEEVPDRIGDLVVVSTGKAGLLHPYKDSPPLKGMHGGLSPQEILVPLLLSRLDGKEVR